MIRATRKALDGRLAATAFGRQGRPACDSGAFWLFSGRILPLTERTGGLRRTRTARSTVFCVVAAFLTEDTGRFVAEVEAVEL